MKDWIFYHVMGTMLPAILGPLTYVVSGWVLNLWRVIDELPPLPKRAIVFAIAFTLAAGAQVLGFALPGECGDLAGGGLTPGCQAALSAPVFLKALLGAFGAYLLHAMKKSDPREQSKVA
jgi:hypothetical protein